MKKLPAFRYMHRLGLIRALCLSKLSACARVRTKKTAQALALASDATTGQNTTF